MPWPNKNSALPSILLLIAIALLGAWLRFRDANDSLWLDELHTAWVAQADSSELVSRAAMGNQSPLYFYGVAAASRLLGPGEIPIRLLSLLAGSLLPLAVALLARRLLDWDGQAGSLSYVPLLAAWLVAVDPKAIFYAQEARPYACVQLLAVVHVLLLVEVLQRPTLIKRLAWIACGGLLFYLHYTAALIVAAELVFAISWLIFGARRRREFDRPALAHWTVDLLILILLCLPTLVPLREIYERRHNWDLFVDRVGLAQLAELPSMIPWSAAALFYPVAFAVTSATRYPLSLRERARVTEDGTLQEASTHQAVDSSIALLLCWLILPITFVAITSAADWLRLWHVRYLIGVTPAAFLLAAMLPRLAPTRFVLAVALAIALYAGWSSHHRLDWTSPHGHSQRSEDWRAAVEFLNRQRDDAPVLLRSGLIEADALRTTNDARLAEYCCFPLTALYHADRPLNEIHPLTTTDAGRLTDSLHSEIQPQPGETETIWLVTRGDMERADRIMRELQLTFAQHATTVRAVNAKSFGRVQAYEVELAAAPR